MCREFFQSTKCKRKVWSVVRRRFDTDQNGSVGDVISSRGKVNGRDDLGLLHGRSGCRWRCGHPAQFGKVAKRGDPEQAIFRPRPARMTRRSRCPASRTPAPDCRGLCPCRWSARRRRWVLRSRSTLKKYKSGCSYCIIPRCSVTLAPPP